MTAASTETKPQHTPGPWRVEGELRRRVIKNAKGSTVVVIEHWTTEEDARLIAAAPLLFEALKWLIEHPACQASYTQDCEMARRVDRGITALLAAGANLPDEWPPAVAKAQG